MRHGHSKASKAPLSMAPEGWQVTASTAGPLSSTGLVEGNSQMILEGGLSCFKPAGLVSWGGKEKGGSEGHLP